METLESPAGDPCFAIAAGAGYALDELEAARLLLMQGGHSSEGHELLSLAIRRLRAVVALGELVAVSAVGAAESSGEGV